ncbi:MAG: gfo/Idh/MocA family oxidoreductase, partial [Solirubrobacteraceae bacterium]
MTGGKLMIGVVGLGYWGPNLARNFAAVDGCEVAWLCDGEPDALARAGAAHPAARTATRLDD